MAKILVIGDAMLDHYVFCRALRLSQEAPVPIAEIEREKWILGGAANVANNCAALGAKTSLVSIVGCDENGKCLLAIAERNAINLKIHTVGITTVKTRFVAGCSQLLRIDRDAKIDGKILFALLSNIDFDAFDMIILSDYDKGTFDQPVISQFDQAKRIVAAPKPNHFGHTYFRKAEAIILNELEFGAAAKLRNICLINDALTAQFAIRENKAIMVTRGARSTLLKTSDGIVEIPVKELEVYDATGAGDTVIAAFTIALLDGKSYVDAAHCACEMATAVASKLGTRTV